MWCAIYASDYYLTIYAARLYQTNVKERIVFEGSYELTPYFQDDVNRLRSVSPRFLRALLISCAGILIIWWLSTQSANLPELYVFLFGALFLREAAIHVRHARNVVFFKHAQDGIKGKLEYSRWFTLKTSAAELFSFAALFLFVFLVTGSWFCLGGAVTCGVTGQQHRGMSKKAISSTQPAPSIQSDGNGS